MEAFSCQSLYLKESQRYSVAPQVAVARNLSSTVGDFSMMECDISGIFIGTAGIRPILRVFLATPNLQKVSLRCTGLSDQAVPLIHKAMRVHTSWKWVDISNNPISNSVGEHVATLRSIGCTVIANHTNLTTVVTPPSFGGGSEHQAPAPAAHTQPTQGGSMRSENQQPVAYYTGPTTRPQHGTPSYPTTTAAPSAVTPPQTALFPNPTLQQDRGGTISRPQTEPGLPPLRDGGLGTPTTPSAGGLSQNRTLQPLPNSWAKIDSSGFPNTHIEGNNPRTPAQQAQSAANSATAATTAATQLANKLAKLTPSNTTSWKPGTAPTVSLLRSRHKDSHNSSDALLHSGQQQGYTTHNNHSHIQHSSLNTSNFQTINHYHNQPRVGTSPTIKQLLLENGVNIKTHSPTHRNSPLHQAKSRKLTTAPTTTSNEINPTLGQQHQRDAASFVNISGKSNTEVIDEGGGTQHQDEHTDEQQEDVYQQQIQMLQQANHTSHSNSSNINSKLSAVTNRKLESGGTNTKMSIADSQTSKDHGPHGGGGVSEAKRRGLRAELERLYQSIEDGTHRPSTEQQQQRQQQEKDRPHTVTTSTQYDLDFTPEDVEERREEYSPNKKETVAYMTESSSPTAHNRRSTTPDSRSRYHSHEKRGGRSSPNTVLDPRMLISNEAIPHDGGVRGSSRGSMRATSPGWNSVLMNADSPSKLRGSWVTVDTRSNSRCSTPVIGNGRLTTPNMANTADSTQRFQLNDIDGDIFPLPPPGAKVDGGVDEGSDDESEMTTQEQPMESTLASIDDNQWPIGRSTQWDASSKHSDWLGEEDIPLSMDPAHMPPPPPEGDDWGMAKPELQADNDERTGPVPVGTWNLQRTTPATIGKRSVGSNRYSTHSKPEHPEGPKPRKEKKKNPKKKPAGPDSSTPPLTTSLISQGTAKQQGSPVMQQATLQQENQQQLEAIMPSSSSKQPQPKIQEPNEVAKLQSLDSEGEEEDDPHTPSTGQSNRTEEQVPTVVTPVVGQSPNSNQKGQGGWGNKRHMSVEQHLSPTTLRQSNSSTSWGNWNTNVSPTTKSDYEVMSSTSTVDMSNKLAQLQSMREAEELQDLQRAQKTDSEGQSLRGSIDPYAAMAEELSSIAPSEHTPIKPAKLNRSTYQAPTNKVTVEEAFNERLTEAASTWMIPPTRNIEGVLSESEAKEEMHTCRSLYHHYCTLFQTEVQPCIEVLLPCYPDWFELVDFDLPITPNNQKLTPKDIAAMAEVLAMNHRTLERVTLPKCNLTDEALWHLLNCLEKCTKLHILHITFNPAVTDIGGQMIVSFMHEDKEGVPLTDVDITGTTIRDVSVVNSIQFGASTEEVNRQFMRSTPFAYPPQM